jgi:hypothetical protein
VTTLVNIGLAGRNGQRIAPRIALATLAVIAGVAPIAATVQQSDSEPTLVAELRQPLTATAAYAVAQHLGQDAIAVFDGRDGSLIGPNAAAWGPFDPSFFLNLDGSRLTAPLPLAA